MKKITAAIIGINALAISGVSLAETVQQVRAGAAIEEVIITAQRRQESAQYTALAISVLGGEDLRSEGVGSPDDLTRLTPGLQISGGTTSQVFIRGVGDFGVTATASPGVATNLDGVVIARPQAIAGNFFDLQRVEVVKGPQGTLYGRNATGGVLNLISAAPVLGETSGYVEVDFGNYSQAGVEGAFNFPVTDQLAMRLSYDANRRDGYLSDDTDDDDRESLRLQALYEADALSIKAMASYIDLGGKGSGLVVLNGPSSDWTGNTDPVAGAAYLAAATAQFNGALAGGCNPAPPPAGNCPPAPALLADPSESNPFRDVQTYSAQVQLDYDFDWAQLTVIPAYRKTDARFFIQPSFGYNVGGVYSANGDRSDGETSDQHSLEVRLGGESDRLSWVVGGFYFSEDQENDFSMHGGSILNQRVIGELETRAHAVFSQLTFEVADNFRLTGGLRYTEDERISSSLQKFAISPSISAPSPITGLPPIPCLPGVPVAGANPPGQLCSLLNPDPSFYDSDVRFTELTWKAGFEYDLAPESLLYADVSTGFKAGGFNQATSLSNPNALQPYEPEQIKAYTVGVKNRFLNNRLQLNMEAFYWDYTDMQLSAQGIDGAGLTVLLTQNAGEATIQGLAADIVAVPWDGGLIKFNVEYIDSEYEHYEITQLAMFAPPGRTGCGQNYGPGGLVTLDCSGHPLIRTPEFSGNLGIEQDFMLGNGGTLVLKGDMAFSSKYFITTDFRSDHEVDSYTNLSASLTYHAPKGNWYASAYVRNITDEVIYSGGGGHQSGFVQGWTTTSIAPPRTYGLRVGLNF